METISSTNHKHLHHSSKYTLTDADVVYWSKQPIWDIEEVILLSLGFDPNRCREDEFAYLEFNACSELKKRKATLYRFITANKITAPASPTELIKLGLSLGWHFKDELINLVNEAVELENGIQEQYESEKDCERLIRTDAIRVKDSMLCSALKWFYSLDALYQRGDEPHFSNIGQKLHELLSDRQKKQRGNTPANFAKALSEILNK